MTAYYPQFVEHGKTTICGLPMRAASGDPPAMSEEPAPHAVIGQRLVAIREGFSDLDQRNWALKHGFGITQWNNWEKGIRRITVDEAERLCALYGLSLDFIYLGRRDGLSEKASKIV